MDDYQDYIQKLPPKDKGHVGPVDFFEDETGQHAIKFEIDVNNSSWIHTIIYNNENKRIRVIKYYRGRYMS